MIVIRPAQVADVTHVASRLRLEDEREVMTSAGQPGTTVVPQSFKLSRECYTVWYVNEAALTSVPCALFGVCDGPDDVGIVWMLCTDDVRHCAMSLVRESEYWLNHMTRHYPRGLHARADARNDLHLRWCRLSGFYKTGSEQVNGFRFIHIHRMASTSV